MHNKYLIGFKSLDPFNMSEVYKILLDYKQTIDSSIDLFVVNDLILFHQGHLAKDNGLIDLLVDTMHSLSIDLEFFNYCQNNKEIKSFDNLTRLVNLKDPAHLFRYLTALGTLNLSQNNLPNTQYVLAMTSKLNQIGEVLVFERLDNYLNVDTVAVDEDIFSRFVTFSYESIHQKIKNKDPNISILKYVISNVFNPDITNESIEPLKYFRSILIDDL